ncbi:MAG: acyltransferase [Muribaculaceae bacterium]
MRINGKNIRLSQLFFLLIYYCIAQFLPNSYCLIKPLGKISNWIRILCAKNIFKKCGKIKTINRRVNFGSGLNIEMGDGSGIGANVQIPSTTIIGKNTIVSRNVFILPRNHRHDRTDIPIKEQGYDPDKQTIIGDDCWVGMNSLLTPGRIISDGTIVAMGSVLTKDFPAYSIVGGAPAKFIKSRKST